MTDEKEQELRKAADADPSGLFDTLADIYTKEGVDVREDLGIHNPVTKKVIDPTRWAKRMVDGATAAGTKWLDGVNNPSRSPTAAGIAAEDKWRDRLNQAIQENRRVKGLQKTSDDTIKATANALGTGVYTSGVSARTTKIQARVNELQPLFQAASDSIQAMSDKTDADREKRLIQARKAMIDLGKKRRA